MANAYFTHAMRDAIAEAMRDDPTVFVFGAIFTLLADTLARTVLSPVELPVGVITALCGAPLFIYLLHRRRSGA